MTTAFLYWWECLWIFEGPFNLAWEEIGKQRPLWVAFILPQHNMLLFLKALYNSCVNPLLWWNVSITQRPISHTHYNGVIHIPPPFFLSIYLFNMNDIAKKSDKNGHSRRSWIQNYCSTDSSYSRWPPLCERARAFVWILNSIHIRAVKRAEQRNGRKDDQR